MVLFIIHINIHEPDNLLGVAAVDCIDIFLNCRTRFCFDLLHFLQTTTGNKQAACLTVMRKNL